MRVTDLLAWHVGQVVRLGNTDLTAYGEGRYRAHAEAVAMILDPSASETEREQLATFVQEWGRRSTDSGRLRASSSQILELRLYVRRARAALRGGELDAAG